MRGCDSAARGERYLRRLGWPGKVAGFTLWNKSVSLEISGMALRFGGVGGGVTFRSELCFPDEEESRQREEGLCL